MTRARPVKLPTPYRLACLVAPTSMHQLAQIANTFGFRFSEADVAKGYAQWRTRAHDTKSHILAALEAS